MVKALYPLVEMAVTEPEGVRYLLDSVGRAVPPSPGSHIYVHSELELPGPGKYPPTVQPAGRRHGFCLEDQT